MPSLAQQKAMAIIPHITGALSFFGSCSILYDIWANRKRKLQRPYYRILLGMSIYDAAASFSLSMSTWPIPRGSEGVWGAVGTTQTCTAQGFFNQILLGSVFYNLMLSTYYLLLGRYHLSEEVIAKRFEPYMHAVAVIVPTGIAIAGLPLTLYNNANLWCWIAAYPPGSEGHDGSHSDGIECTRGHGAWLYRWVFFYGPLWFIIVAITVMMIMLTRSVKTEEKRFIEMMLRKECSSRGDDEKGDDNESSDIPTEESPPPRPRVESFNLERSRKMFHQAVFYVLAFYITWLFATINRMVQLITGASSVPLLILHTIFVPLQGFLNFLVYRHGPCVA